jgi:hypothetical protein
MAISNLKMASVPGHTLAYKCIQWLIENGCITGANLDSLSTVAGLVAAANAVVLPEHAKRNRTRAVTYLTDNATEFLTNANVVATAAEAEADRIAFLRAIFTARDTDLTASTPAGLPE